MSFKGLRIWTVGGPGKASANEVSSRCRLVHSIDGIKIVRSILKAPVYVSGLSGGAEKKRAVFFAHPGD